MGKLLSKCRGRKASAVDLSHSKHGIDRTVSYSPNECDILDSLLNEERNDHVIDCLLGCAYGQALGDAYGLSTEFENQLMIKEKYPNVKDLIPFPKYIATYHNRRWKQGDWTDDTDQWILVLETLINYDGDEKMFAKKLKSWIENGFPELGDSVGRGLGANVRKVVYTDGYLEDPHRISKMVWEQSNRQAAPNGALMRCSAVAFVHYNNLEKVVSKTMAICKTTHFDPRCIASCLAVCLTVTHLIIREYSEDEIEQLVERIQEQTIQILGDDLTQEDRTSFLWYTNRSRTLEDLKLDEPTSIGYTYKCLASGFYGLRSTRSFQETLNDLIRCGGDADTNGAVCGTMFGARYGFRKLPFEWLRAMPYKKWFDLKILKYLQQKNLIHEIVN